MAKVIRPFYVKSSSILLPRLFVGATMGLSAFSKLSQPKELLATLNASGLVTPNLILPLAYLLIAAEVIVALFMLIPVFNRMGFMLCALLSSVFFSYSIWRWFQDIRTPCSCFGVLLKLAPWQSLILSVVLCAASFYCLQRLTKFQAKHT